MARVRSGWAGDARKEAGDAERDGYAAHTLASRHTLRYVVASALAAELALMLVVAIAPHAAAQSGGGDNLMWSAIDGGGATFSTGGADALGSTIGQADAGSLSGGAYTLHGGFWSGASGMASCSYRWCGGSGAPALYQRSIEATVNHRGRRGIVAAHSLCALSGKHC
ncbi:hypothetical protein [Chloroflexus sp.]|uniref:hypothetical protein n=1 Tax=Chloroflexus sp. TaxID=1904827 RepID=UPI002ACE7DB2|nr:hypothetical protein [Chloroflexus sp.]